MRAARQLPELDPHARRAWASRFRGADPPNVGTAAPLPLNALDGAPLDQTLTVEIDRTGVADGLRRLHDVVLLVEYSAMI